MIIFVYKTTEASSDSKGSTSPIELASTVPFRRGLYGPHPTIKLLLRVSLVSTWGADMLSCRCYQNNITYWFWQETVQLAFIFSRLSFSLLPVWGISSQTSGPSSNATSFVTHFPSFADVVNLSLSISVPVMPNSDLKCTIYIYKIVLFTILHNNLLTILSNSDLWGFQWQAYSCSQHYAWNIAGV